MTDLFTNQVALITGAASGLGRAIAKRLSANGVILALVDKDFHATQKAEHELYGNAELFQIDVAEEQVVEECIQKLIEKFQRIDILVNSAGITGITNVKTHETSTENLKEVFGVNFMGAYFTSKHVLPHMLKQHYGRILHIASIAGKEGNAGMLAYSTSKAAVIGMTKVQGKEYAETGITVNALAPAVIETAFLRQMPPEQIKYMTDKIPMKRCGKEEEVADIAEYIVSPKNSFTTGFTFDLSGGRATY